MNKIRKIFCLCLLLAGLGACSESNKAEGDDHFQAGRYQEAVEAYSQNLEINPDNVAILYSRARAYEELNDYESAIADFQAALKYDDRNVKVLLSLGDIFYKQKKFDNALFYYEQATDLESNNPNALFNAGRAHHKLGNVKEAMSLYEAAIREDKNFGEAYLFRGALKVSQKKNKAACDDFRKAQKLGIRDAAEAVQKYCR